MGSKRQFEVGLNTRPSRSLFREFRLINWLTRKVLLHTYILLRGAAVRIVRAAVLFFYRRRGSRLEKMGRSCDFSVSEKWEARWEEGGGREKEVRSA